MPQSYIGNDFTGRAMKGYVFVDPEGIDEDHELAEWLQMCLGFNPAAKASKKKGGNWIHN